MNQITFDGMEPEYYAVKLNEQILKNADFEQNDSGMYEKMTEKDPMFVVPVTRCPYCGQPVIGFHEKIIRNGTMQITAVCRNNCGYNAPITEAAREFIRKIRE